MPKGGATITKSGKKYKHISKSSNLEPYNEKYRYSQKYMDAYNKTSAIQNPELREKLIKAMGINEKNEGQYERTVLYGFDSKNKHDDMVYKGAYSKYLSSGKSFTKLYEHDLVTKYDTISPSKKERVDAFIETYSNNKKLFSTVITKNDDMLAPYKDNPQYKNLIDTYYTNLDRKQFENMDYVKKNADKLYTSFVRSQVYKNGDYGEANTKYVNSLLDRGYDAIQDENNIGVYNKAETSTIFLNPENSLKVSKSKPLSYISRDSALRKLERDAKKRGYKVAL